MKRRIVTAAILIPVVLGAVLYSNSTPLWVLATLVAAVAAIELAVIVGVSGVLLAGLTLGSGFMEYHFSAYALLWPVLWMADCAFLLARPKAIFGFLYLSVPLTSIAFLHDIRPEFALLPFVPLWIGDTLAILVGRKWGKNPMAPTISPKKTWEGGAANFLGCMAGAIALASWLNLSVVVGLLVGLSAGLLGQVGDLFESQLKRRAGVKDSGGLLPGHGGVLDRIDSILFAAPAIFLIVRLLN